LKSTEIATILSVPFCPVTHTSSIKNNISKLKFIDSNGRYLIGLGLLIWKCQAGQKWPVPH